MRECGLLHEIDPSLPFPRLESSLYDDCKSSLSLESNVADDAPLADLDEVFGPPLTSLPFVAPSFSSIPMDTSFSNLTLLASSLPLVQCTGLEMDEISRGYASIIEDDSLGWSEEFTLDEPCLKEAPVEELRGDDVMVRNTPSIGHTDSICFELLD